MGGLWGDLIPLIIGSAVVPIQIVITIMLLRSGSGPGKAAAWLAGMTAVRLVQGVVFGLIFGNSEHTDDTSTGGQGPVVSVVLLVIAVVFYLTAFKQIFKTVDDDAPPPQWMAKLESTTPLAAFGFGAAILALGAKPWVFTLGAVGAIKDANLSTASAIGTFLLFVVLAESIHIVLVGAAVISPSRAERILGPLNDWMERNNRIIVIAIGLVFGTWFAIKALRGLGVI